MEDETVDEIIDSTVISLSKLWETVKDMESWCAVHGATKSLTWLNDWTAKTNKARWPLECRWKKRGKKTQKWWNNYLWISQVSKYISKVHLCFWVNPTDLAYRVVHYCTNYMSQLTGKIPSACLCLPALSLQLPVHFNPETCPIGSIACRVMFLSLGVIMEHFFLDRVIVDNLLMCFVFCLFVCLVFGLFSMLSLLSSNTSNCWQKGISHIWEIHLTHS